MTGAIFCERRPADDHEVGLPWRWAKDFGAETCNIKARGGHGHHFNSTARETETQRPDGALARPVHSLVELRKDDALVFEELPEVIGFWSG